MNRNLYKDKLVNQIKDIFKYKEMNLLKEVKI